jgi:nucleotide-binding universal stress UspA family protein
MPSDIECQSDQESQMNVKDILVFLDEGDASGNRLRLAINIAGKHGACLGAAYLSNEKTLEPALNIGLARFPALGGLPLDGATEIAPEATRADDAERHFHESLRSLRIEGDWHTLTKTETTKAIALARAADLVILGQTNPRVRIGPGFRPDEIIVSCGRPVLIVPYIGEFGQIGRRVLIAWDGSQEAARAVNDALPVIGAADTVEILTIYSRPKDFERDSKALERIERHLARHGLPVHADHAMRTGNTVSEALLSRAFDISADLIVAGGFHRSPLRETLIGGVSRELLQAMTVPILMSH